MQKKNVAFVLSIVMLSLSAVALILTFLSRQYSDPFIYLPLLMFSLALFIPTNIALVKGIIHMVRKVPRALETIIMSSIAVVLFLITYICLFFLIGTGRLPHEIFIY